MKLVRKNLFEKFEEDSDPIKDMGIGNPFLKLQRGDHIKCIKMLHRGRGKNIYKNSYAAVKNVKKSDSDLQIEGIFFSSTVPRNIDIEQSWQISLIGLSYEKWGEHFEIIKRTVNEKFTEDSDPIKDMGIGIFRKNTNFTSAEDLMKAVYSNFYRILDPKEKMDWSTEENFRKNIQYFLDTPSKEVGYRSILMEKIYKFKIAYLWTVNKKPYLYWIVDISQFLKSKNFNTIGKLR